jgi:hypothetical protein
MSKKPAFYIASLLFVLTGVSAFSPSAHAYEWGRGRWIHDRHSGRLGWWWVVGPSWYYYTQPHSFVVVQQPQPVIVQQAPAQPQTVVVEQQPAPPAPASTVMVAPPQNVAVQQPVLFYCKATGTNYPETMTCPGGWSTMTAQTPPQP